MSYSMQILVEDCPNMIHGCRNDGCIPYQLSEGEWAAQQCEFCYTIPWSRFNIDSIKEAYSNREVKTGRIDGTKLTLSNVPKSKEEE